MILLAVAGWVFVIFIGAIILMTILAGIGQAWFSIEREVKDIKEFRKNKRLLESRH